MGTWQQINGLDSLIVISVFRDGSPKFSIPDKYMAAGQVTTNAWLINRQCVQNEEKDQSEQKQGDQNDQNKRCDPAAAGYSTTSRCNEVAGGPLKM